MASTGDSVKFSNIAANTSAFPLLGGKYGVAATGTFGGGSIALQILLPDGSTWVPAFTAFAAAGFSVIDLPPGQYRLAIATATAVYASVTRIPS
jgi:hypothetical protein